MSDIEIVEKQYGVFKPGTKGCPYKEPQQPEKTVIGTAANGPQQSSNSFLSEGAGDDLLAGVKLDMKGPSVSQGP